MVDPNNKPEISPVEIVDADLPIELRGYISGPTTDVITEEEILKRIQHRKNILRLTAAATNNRDWHDYDGRPYFTGTGADAVCEIVGVWYQALDAYRENQTDDIGQYYIWTVTGIAGFTPRDEKRCLSIMGACSSRDKFFSKRGNELKAPHEIDESNIKKKAYNNFVRNAVSRVCALRSLTWDDLEALGFKREKAGGKTEFKRGRTESQSYEGSKPVPPTDDEKEQAAEIGRMLMRYTDGDASKAGDKLEELTTFEGKNGTVKGKRRVDQLTAKQIPVVYGMVKKLLEEGQ